MTILAIGGLQGFLLFILLVTDKRVNYASKLLGIYCLLLALTLMVPLLVSGEANSLSWLIGWLVFLPASFGAMSYLYCRVAMTGSALKYFDLIHLIPLLICYLLNYDILFSGQKALQFMRTPNDNLLSIQLTLVVLYGQAIVYGALLIRMIYRYQTKAKQTLSSYNRSTFRWHWGLATFMVLIWSLKALSSVTSFAGPMVNFIADCLLVILVYVFAITQWRNPALFHVQQLDEQLAQSAKPKSEFSPDGVLDHSMRSSVLNLVQDKIEKQALYRDSELTLAALAEQVGVSVHHLSETLNQYGGKNFNRFINEYRVTEVCQQLKQNSDRKLIDLALDAGFSSKSSFNAIFKKLTGKTPSAYRQELAES
jgi:AraC-like DNA-binding protein